MIMKQMDEPLAKGWVQIVNTLIADTFFANFAFFAMGFFDSSGYRPPK
jgi:hypothetical protein